MSAQEEDFAQSPVVECRSKEAWQRDSLFLNAFKIGPE